MRRPPPALALAAPVVAVDDVFITRLAGLAAASVPSRVPVRPATLKVAAAAAGVAVIAAGGAYAADQLTAPAPSHHVPPAGEPTTRSGPSPTSRSSERTPASSGADERARDLGGDGNAASGEHGAGKSGAAHGQGHGRGPEHGGDQSNQGMGQGQGHGDGDGDGFGDEADHGRKGHGNGHGNGQGNGQGTGIDQGLGLGNVVVPDPPVSGD